jgi:putative membrane protein
MTRNALLALSALTLAACGQQAATTETAETPAIETPAMQTAQITDADFVQQVANAGAFEIQSSELAPQRARLQTVKAFAERMITDHRAADQQLAAAATGMGMSAPTPQLSAEQQAALDSLRTKSGEEFDDAYLDAQVSAHEDAVRLFETYLAGAQPGALRDFAQNTLPTLRTHLTDVQAMENAS